MPLEIYPSLKNTFQRNATTSSTPPEGRRARTSIIRVALLGVLMATSLGAVWAATPVVNAPATQNVERETYLVFNTTNSNLISITDADSDNQTVTITVTNGSFFLEDVTGLSSASFTGTGQQEITAGPPVSFSGSFANVNAALSEASFYPTDGYAGSASVQIDTRDTNNDTDSRTINITVLAGTDTDGDGIYDHKDLDDDNDGIPDNVENPCEKTFTFDLSSEGWFTINNGSHTRNYNGIWVAEDQRHVNAGSDLVPPASHSTDPATGNDNCDIDNTGRANKNIAGASPTRTNYIVDADPSGGLMYLRSPNLGGIDYSALEGGTFQYDAYNYRVGRTGNPNWIGSSKATVYIFNTQGEYVSAQSDLTQNPHFNRFQNGLWNTFAFPLNTATWTGDASLADVLADVDQISIRMEYIGGGNTGNCSDVEYYAMDNVVLTAQSSCDDDVDNDGIPNSLDPYNNITSTYDADAAGHGQPYSTSGPNAGQVIGPVGTDGIPDAVQGPGNGDSGGAQYPPILDLNGSDGNASANHATTFTEDGGAIAIADASATLYDGNDADNLSSLTVVLTNRPDGGDESLSVNGGLLGGITAGAYDPATGTLKLSGSASSADYLDALKKIVYNNTSQDPDPTARSITVVANDGKADSNTGTTTVTVVPVNDAPTAADKTLTTGEDVAKIVETADLGYSDTEGDELSLITLTAIPDPTKGILFVDSNNSGGLDNGETALAISDVVTKAQLDADELTFAPAANTSGNAHASFAFRVNDGTDEATSANTITFKVDAVNDAPVVSTPGNQSIDEDNSFDFDASNLITISDADGDNQTVTITVTDGMLTLSGSPNITAGSNSSGSMEFTGTLAEINAALANAQFTPTANFNGNAEVTVATDDGNSTDNTDSETITITVNPQDDKPVVDLDQDDNNTNATSGNYETTFNEGDPGLTIADSDATLDNPDGPDLTSLTVTLTNRPNGAQEGLSVKDITTVALPGGITVSDPYDDADGQLVLSGPASLADFEAALQRIIYTNASENPNDADRTITVVANDGTKASVPVATLLSVTPVNSAPVVFLNGSDDTDYVATFTEDGGAVAVADAGAATLTDVDHSTLRGLTVVVTDIDDAGEELLSVVNLPASLTSLYNAATGTLEITNADSNSPGSVADYQTALRGLRYENTSQNPTTGDRSITVVANDGAASNPAVETVMTVNAANDAPVVSVPTNPQSTDEDNPLTFATGTNPISISDADGDNQTVTITVTGGKFSLSQITNLNAPFTQGDGTEDAVMEFSGPLSDINAALANATFTPDAEFSGKATVSIQSNDGNATGSNSFDVEVNATNDAPKANNASVTTYVDETYAFADTDFSANYSDVENHTFAGITVVTLPNASEGTLNLNGNPVTAGATIGAADLSNGDLEFVPAAGQTGSPLASFTFQVTDSEGASSVDYTMSVAVKARPTSADATVAAQEDTELKLSDADFAFSDAADAAPDAFAGVVITQLPAQGTLFYEDNSGTAVPVSTTDVTNGMLFADRSKFSFKANENDNGTGYATIGFRVQDAAGDQSVPHTLTIDVAPVDDRPEVSNVPKATITNQAVSFAPADFIDQFNDVDDDPLAEIMITSLPPATEGTLTLDGQPVTANTPIPAISLSKLTFTPATGFTGTSSFGWNASDGNNYAATGAEVQVTVAEQTPPVVSNVPKASVAGDTVRFAPTDFMAAFSDAESNPLQTIKITSLPPVAQGTLFLDGVVVGEGDEIPLTSIDRLTLVPAAGFAGTASFGWNGFDGTDYATDESTVTLTVNAVPQVTPEPLAVTNGTTYFGTLAEQVTDAEGHALTFGTTPTTDVAHGTLTLNDDGSFIYVPEVGYAGEDSFTYTVCDDGTPSACTTGMATLQVGAADAPDSDNDGIPDAVEKGSDSDNPTDSDGDGTPDYQDDDSDNDGIPDAQEAGPNPAAPVDTDQDGTPDYQDTDSDNDGIPDATEAGDNPTAPQDTDDDGTPDHLDTDSDGDGIADATEVGGDPSNPTDTDNDGVPDYRDTDSDGDGTPDRPDDGLVIYEGFSPNDDNKNETWQIGGIENYPDNKVQIYNRWGNLLFEVQGYNNRDKAWGSDASVGLILGSKNVPDGTYFYLIDLGDGSPIRKGFITVHR